MSKAESHTTETPEEKAKRLGVHLIPKRVDIWPDNKWPNEITSVCGECGLELYRVMGYCCPRSNCPCGLGSPTCLIQ